MMSRVIIVGSSDECCTLWNLRKRCLTSVFHGLSTTHWGRCSLHKVIKILSWPEFIKCPIILASSDFVSSVLRFLTFFNDRSPFRSSCAYLTTRKPILNAIAFLKLRLLNEISASDNLLLLMNACVLCTMQSYFKGLRYMVDRV